MLFLYPKSYKQPESLAIMTVNGLDFRHNKG
nr:MAG TPA: hypothetical protein [Caudoviricetes sp.]